MQRRLVLAGLALAAVLTGAAECSSQGEPGHDPGRPKCVNAEGAEVPCPDPYGPRIERPWQ